jgi:dTDP-4-amino-4,6-dideoxygalactose transaminase
MQIPWSGKSYNLLNKEIKYLTNFLSNSKTLTQGNELKLFETSLRKYLGKKNIFCLSSAASALEIIATFLNIKKGDEIIIPAHTYCASAIPFARLGAKIVWADINLDTRVIDLHDVKKKINKKTKAILIVHLNGYAVDVNKFKKINKRIKIIEDCAQAFGAQVNEKKVGTLGDFSCFSFHAQKNLTTLGEGGAIFVKNNLLAKKVPSLRHNGHRAYKKRKFFWKPAMGNVDQDLSYAWPYKFTLSEIQCAAGRLVLKRIDSLNNKRIIRAKKIISELKHIKELKFHSCFESKKRHVYHLLNAYVAPNKRVNKNKLIEILNKKFRIQCIVQYYPLYKYPLFKKFGQSKQICKNAEKFYTNMISFPFHVWMTDRDVNYMINSIKKVYNFRT